MKGTLTLNLVLLDKLNPLVLDHDEELTSFEVKAKDKVAVDPTELDRYPSMTSVSISAILLLSISE